MKNIDCIIEQIKEGIKLQKILITRENPETEIGYKNIELYKCKIAELEYRIKELDAKKITELFYHQSMEMINMPLIITKKHLIC